MHGVLQHFHFTHPQIPSQILGVQKQRTSVCWNEKKHLRQPINPRIKLKAWFNQLNTEGWPWYTEENTCHLGHDFYKKSSHLEEEGILMSFLVHTFKFLESLWHTQFQNYYWILQLLFLIAILSVMSFDRE